MVLSEERTCCRLFDDDDDSDDDDSIVFSADINGQGTIGSRELSL